MKFNLSDYPDSKVVMHVETEEQDLIFRTFLDAQGRTWRNGTSYLANIYYAWYQSETCHAFNMGRYCDLEHYTSRGYTVLSFSDFEWDNYTPPEKEKPVKLRFTW